MGTGIAEAEIPMFSSRDERTCFQIGEGYGPQTDIKSDVAIVYGIDPSLPERLEGWRARGSDLTKRVTERQWYARMVRG